MQMNEIVAKIDRESLLQHWLYKVEIADEYVGFMKNVYQKFFQAFFSCQTAILVKSISEKIKLSYSRLA